MDQAALENQTRLAVAGQQQRAVEVDVVGMVGEQHGRGHGERGADHAADHQGEAARPRLVGEHHRLGEAAGLVELDVDGVVARSECVEPGAVVQALVGADRDRACDLAQERVVAGRQRLLDQADARRDAGGQVRLHGVGSPRLVGVDDEPRIRRATAHGGDPLGVALAAELHLQERAGGGVAGRRLHALGRAEAERVGGDRDLRRGEARDLPGRAAELLGLQVEQGAVEGVAGGPRGHQGEEIEARGPGGDGIRLRHEEVGDALDALAVAGIGHAFAAPA